MENDLRDKKRLQRFLPLLGGFIILVGVVLFGLCTLVLFGYLDPGLLLESKHLLVFAVVMIMIGLFDFIAAIMIARW